MRLQRYIAIDCKAYSANTNPETMKRSKAPPEISWSGPSPAGDESAHLLALLLCIYSAGQRVKDYSDALDVWAGLKNRLGPRNN